MRPREENPQYIQGFNAAEEVNPTAAFGSSSPCHPELFRDRCSKNEQPGRVASERRTGPLVGGPLTDNVVFSSDQRNLASVQRFMGTRSRTGALRDDSRRALGDDTPKRHPDNAPGQDLCPSRKMGQTIGAGQSLFSLSSSRERSELSNIRFVGSCKRSAISEKRVFEKRVFDGRSRTGALRDDRRGVRRGRLYGMPVLLPSRHPDNGPGQDPCPSRKRDSIFHERARTGERRREEKREKEIENTREVSSSRERSELSNIRFLGSCKRSAISVF